MRSKLPVILIAGFSFLVGACNSTSTDLLQPGSYQGTLIRRTDRGLSENLISATISNSDPQTWAIAIQSPSEQLKVAIDGAGAVLLDLPALWLKPVKLTSQDDCFSNAGEVQSRFCQDRTDLLLEIRDSQGTLYSLSLHADGSGHEVPPEKPASYTLDDAMKRAFANSFESRAQFERMMQASHLATNAWWNLLPRLNLNMGVSAAKSITGGFLELVGEIGDLAPFLLPTRWIQAENASQQSNAQKIGVTIMRGDTGVQLESLIYSWKKDRDLLGEYEEILGESGKLSNEIRTLEVYGLYPPGTADTIETSIDQMKADQAALDGTCDDELAAISQAMGFVNPNAVTEIVVGDLPPDSNFDHLDEATLEEEVLSRSPEMNQINLLAQIAENSKKATFFQWLDPSGDPDSSLGAGFPSALEIGQDKVDQIALANGQLQAVLRQKARQALDDYQAALASESLAAQDNGLQEQRKERVLELVKYGKDTNLVELVNVYQDLLRSRVNQRTAQAEVQVARAKLERLLLEGYYSQLSFVPPAK